MDTIYFDDGDRVRKKAGEVEKIEDGVVYFVSSISKEHMLIPLTQIIRIVKSDGRGW